MFAIILYVLAAGLLLLSFFARQEKDEDGAEKSVEVL